MARRVAVDVLWKVREDGAFGNLVLPQFLSEAQLSGRDAAFATEITYGSLRTMGICDAIIDAASDRPVGRLDGVVLDCLRLGVYQLLFTKVESHAAVDTTVRLAGLLAGGRVTGFVNAVMRRISRTPASVWLDTLAPSDPLARAAWMTGHPGWIAESFAAALAAGPEDPRPRPADGKLPADLNEALAADSSRPGIHLVARPGELTQEELCALTGAAPARFSPYGAYLDSGNPADFDCVRQGLAAVQDEGSQLIARALTEVPVDGPDGGRWLDLCAGPGGKAALIGGIAAIAGARLDAVELAPHRAELIRKTVRDMPVTVITADGTNPPLEPGYDRILVDAPCSGLGALRRRPEARWVKRESAIAELTELQQALLESAVGLLRPGGVIIYSTCSPDIRETRGVVDAVAGSHDNLVELPAGSYFCGMRDTGGFASVQMWPHRHGTDAMFAAVLKKTI
nr:transcription antitermination factor NusB [Corynebacterium mendelii]